MYYIEFQNIQFQVLDSKIFEFQFFFSDLFLLYKR